MAKMLHVATRKGFFVVEKKGTGWSISDPHFPGVHATISLADPRTGWWYVALGHGHFGCKLQRSKDQGKTWEEISPPIYPPKPADIADIVCPMRKTPIPWNLEMIWCLEAGAAEGQLWCGTIPGGLFRSDNNGESWELNRPLWDRPERAQWFGGGYDYPGIHSIAFHPDDKRHLYVAVSCGGIIESTDDGATWKTAAKGMRAEYQPPDLAFNEEIQDAHRMVLCPGQPTHLWVQHHNGIFRSTDGSRSWSEIKTAEPSTFGFAVAVHPKNGDTAWFAPAIKDELRIPTDGKLLVNRTTDGGKTFQQLRSGLPEGKSYDLIYRHGLDIDETGDVLAMGSTTGNLWITENGGEHWQEVSSYLPPIYAVAWAK